MNRASTARRKQIAGTRDEYTDFWNKKVQRYKEAVALIQYIADEDKLEKILENQQIIKTPVVRNGKQATLGYQPEVWKKWE